MYEFELRVIKSGIELSGGQLKGLLVFPASEPERAFRLVRFLSRKGGGVLRIFNAEGKLIKDRRFDTVTPTADTGPLRRAGGKQHWHEVGGSVEAAPAVTSESPYVWLDRRSCSSP